MKRLFPGVKTGDRLSGRCLPGQGAHLRHDSEDPGCADDPAFARFFFGIRRASTTFEAVLRQALAGCGNADVAQHCAERPQLDLASCFNGKVLAHGICQDRSGQAVRRFTVNIEGLWEGKQDVLDEHFCYADGKRERRVWQFTQQADGCYTGTGFDVVGSAIGQVRDAQFDDRMFLVDERVMLNRATTSTFGVRVGEGALSLQKLAT